MGLRGYVSPTPPPAIPTFSYDQAQLAMVPGMAVRKGDTFAGTAFITGNYAGDGVPDKLSVPRGSQAADLFYGNFDPYQGGGFCIWTPEQGSADRSDAIDAYLWYVSSNYYLRYEYDLGRYLLRIGGRNVNRAATLTAGTPEYLAWGFDTNNPVDSTNYAYISRNDAQTYGPALQPTATAPDATIYVGSDGSGAPVNGKVEGLVFVREIPFTGTYGADMLSGVDIVAEHYNSDNGADIAEKIASWGTPFSLPTNATPGAMASGTGHAWSHPWADNHWLDWHCMEPWATAAWSVVGSPTVIDTLSADRLYAGGYKITGASGEGIEQTIATLPNGQSMVSDIVLHSADDVTVEIYDITNTAVVTTVTIPGGGTRTAPGVMRGYAWDGYYTGGAFANYTSLRMRILCTTNQDIYLHMAGAYPNLWADPGFEVGSQVTDVGTPTSTGRSTTQVHSGTYSLEVVAAAADDGIKQTLTTVVGQFYQVTAWVYAATAGTVDMEGPTLQSGSGIATTTVNDAWEQLTFVFRAIATSTDLQFTSNAAQTFYVDDVDVADVSDVSITATPASEANSEEPTGLRIDGFDFAPDIRDASATLEATQGQISWKMAFRHGPDEFLKFAESTTVYMVVARFNATNQILLFISSPDSWRLYFEVGGVVTDIEWSTIGSTVVPNTPYLCAIRYDGDGIRLWADGVDRATDPYVVDWGANIPTDVFWGSTFDGLRQADLTFDGPMGVTMWKVGRLETVSRNYSEAWMSYEDLQAAIADADVDVVWANRPPGSIHPAYNQYDEIPSESEHDDFRAWLNNHNMTGAEVNAAVGLNVDGRTRLEIWIDLVTWILANP